jgi:hypothetical protein
LMDRSMQKIDRDKQIIIIRGAMQVVHQLPSLASSARRQKKADPRGYDASKHSLGRGLSTLTQRPLSCISWDLISTL